MLDGAIDGVGGRDRAIVLVDGRERGRLPLTTPVRVLHGRRLIRVVKDGYRAFEARVEVE